ncbi:MAG: hypothetical protein M3419_07770 [Actinomycetota bacterium]|nr:hypothetical protein [Actinomycetota bacterium]
MRIDVRIGSAVTLLLVTGAVVAPAAVSAAAPNCGATAVAHRGAHATVDENTVESVDRAYALDAFVELDLRVVEGNRLYFMHDNTVDRTTDGTGRIEEMSVEEVNALTTEPHGGQVMSWAAFLDEVRANPGQQAMIEGKKYQDYWVGHPHLIERLQKSLRRHRLLGRVYVGGTRGFLKALRDTAPKVKTFWRAEPDEPLTPDEAEKRSSDLVLAFTGAMTADEVREIQASGRPVWVRLTNDIAVWRTAVEKGATGVTTDRPAAFRRWCRTA